MDRKAELGQTVVQLAREIVDLEEEETQILQTLCEDDATVFAPDLEESMRHNQETLRRKRREHSEAKEALKNLLRPPGGDSMPPPLPRPQSHSASRVPSTNSSRRASVSGSDAELQAKPVASSDSEQEAKPSREVKSKASALAAAVTAGPNEWVVGSVWENTNRHKLAIAAANKVQEMNPSVANGSTKARRSTAGGIEIWCARMSKGGGPGGDGWQSKASRTCSLTYAWLCDGNSSNWTLSECVPEHSCEVTTRSASLAAGGSGRQRMHMISQMKQASSSTVDHMSKSESLSTVVVRSWSSTGPSLRARRADTWEFLTLKLGRC
jgi:hypothetical protein